MKPHPHGHSYGADDEQEDNAHEYKDTSEHGMGGGQMAAMFAKMRDAGGGQGHAKKGSLGSAGGPRSAGKANMGAVMASKPRTPGAAKTGGGLAKTITDSAPKKAPTGSLGATAAFAAHDAAGRAKARSPAAAPGGAAWAPEKKSSSKTVFQAPLGAKSSTKTQFQAPLGAKPDAPKPAAKPGAHKPEKAGHVAGKKAHADAHKKKKGGHSPLGMLKKIGHVVKEGAEKTLEGAVAAGGMEASTGAVKKSLKGGHGFDSGGRHEDH